MMGEAVQEQKAKLAGEPVQEEQHEVKVELPINAHIPHDYVTSERLRLEAYKRIAAISSADHIGEVRDELTDRYGKPPVEVENLLEVARFRIMARRAGLTDVTLQGQNIKFGPGEPARVAAGPAGPALQEGHLQAGGADAAGAGAQDQAAGRPAFARPGVADMVWRSGRGDVPRARTGKLAAIFGGKGSM